MTTTIVIVERCDREIRYADGTIGRASDGSLTWTGRGFATKKEALDYADAVYVGLRLADVSASILDKSEP